MAFPPLNGLPKFTTNASSNVIIVVIDGASGTLYGITVFMEDGTELPPILTAEIDI
jgi:hypothetical protein